MHSKHTPVALLFLAVSALAGASVLPPCDPAFRVNLVERERAAEPGYLRAVALARGEARSDTDVLAALGEALVAGACPTRALTELAFEPLHTDARFRALIRDHAHQWSISMRLPGEPGEPLRVTGAVIDVEGEPIACALVYVYHTDAEGLYSRGGMDEQNPRLFGYMRTDEQGRFSFTTIRPGHYPDLREPVEQHVHGEVRADGFEPLEVRIGFRDDPFWAEQGKPIPRWAAAVEPGEDGIPTCHVDVRLRRSAASGQDGAGA